MVPRIRVFVRARNVPDRFLAFYGFLCSLNSFFHSPRTAQVMQRNLIITSGCILARERALRLVKRVAQAIDDMKTFPTNEEVLQLCSEDTLQDCIHDVLIDVASFFSWWLPLAALADVCWPDLGPQNDKRASTGLDLRWPTDFICFWPRETPTLFRSITVVLFRWAYTSTKSFLLFFLKIGGLQ